MICFRQPPIFFGLLLGLWLCKPYSGYGCSCDPLRSVQAEYQAADLVVYGRIKIMRFLPWADTQTVNLLEGAWLLKTVARLPAHPHIWGSTRAVIIEVLHGFKGAHKGDVITVFTPVRIAACGYNFASVSANYIIYAIRDNFDGSSQIQARLSRPFTLDTFWTSRCNRTQPYSIREITALEKLQSGSEKYVNRRKSG
ncbi:hypothetical protein F5984_00600 [Rudanella paleaurantiibacter]|uniref:Uncharacterized protein n=1 Tax=Rudanella paleaurantiibacter TaxID=2614655 RepID=A0A7J5U3S4_9BACT|nr:hypothetical protein [Rudanella paleaurantiibacter]KAB7732494.1 hypothetical protein F5984_00600 [Rudanella paleaurantiibacter]